MESVHISPDMIQTTQLLFFDTFSHDVHSIGSVPDLNLDLVQFPSPVYISEIRVIPLGAKVTANFPGGVRLGATNPNKFDLELFVNNLKAPGASTFENIGRLQYNQAGCISLSCKPEIATDGLVLRGLYSTITLAVYGTLTGCTPEELGRQAAIERQTVKVNGVGKDVVYFILSVTILITSVAYFSLIICFCSCNCNYFMS